VQALEVGADGARFAQHAPVVELQRRHLRKWTHRAEDVAAVLAGVQIDVDEFDAFNALLGDEHRHAARVRRTGRDKKPHHGSFLASG
jgi:hypothetical protein